MDTSENEKQRLLSTYRRLQQRNNDGLAAAGRSLIRRLLRRAEERYEADTKGSAWVFEWDLRYYADCLEIDSVLRELVAA